MNIPVKKLIHVRPYSDLDSRGFKKIIEDHLDELRQNSTPQKVSEKLITRCRYDFYSLLCHLKIDSRYYWIILRVNNLTSPDEYLGDVRSIMIPELKFVQELLLKYQARNA